MKAKLRNQLNRQLAQIKDMSLQGWLDEASKIFGDAVEGIYCGREGRIHVEVGSGLYLTMGWYTVNTPKVEYAYVS